MRIVFVYLIHVPLPEYNTIIKRRLGSSDGLDIQKKKKKKKKMMVMNDRPPRAGSGIVKIDPLRFLAGCRTRRLNQV